MIKNLNSRVSTLQLEVNELRRVVNLNQGGCGYTQRANAGRGQGGRREEVPPIKIHVRVHAAKRVRIAEDPEFIANQLAMCWPQSIK